MKIEMKPITFFKKTVLLQTTLSKYKKDHRCVFKKSSFHPQLSSFSSGSVSLSISPSSPQHLHRAERATNYDLWKGGINQTNEYMFQDQ